MLQRRALNTSADVTTPLRSVLFAEFDPVPRNPSAHSPARSGLAKVLASGGVLICALFLGAPTPAHGVSVSAETVREAERRLDRRYTRCPTDMVSVWDKFCIDRYEAFVHEVTSSGRSKRHSAFLPLHESKRYRALNARGRMPQAYISQHEAAAACQEAGKRLCTSTEWVMACKGKRPTTWPYGENHEPGRCNDAGISPFRLFFSDKHGRPPPKSAYTWTRLNDPRLNRPPRTCAPSGKFSRCRNSFRLYDMVGNLHEWVADASGTFRGGYYLDVKINGEGCDYRTVAHVPTYHDYSIGFRCCR